MRRMARRIMRRIIKRGKRIRGINRKTRGGIRL